MLGECFLLYSILILWLMLNSKNGLKSEYLILQYAIRTHILLHIRCTAMTGKVPLYVY